MLQLEKSIGLKKIAGIAITVQVVMMVIMMSMRAMMTMTTMTMNTWWWRWALQRCERIEPSGEDQNWRLGSKNDHDNYEGDDDDVGWQQFDEILAFRFIRVKKRLKWWHSKPSSQITDFIGRLWADFGTDLILRVNIAGQCGCENWGQFWINLELIACGFVVFLLWADQYLYIFYSIFE